MIKHIKTWLQLWDGVWSIPLAIAAFVSLGIAGQLVFGEGFAFYDPSIVQAGFLAAALLILFNLVTWLGLWFNFRTVFKYYRIYSKQDFKKLQPWQRIASLLFLYIFYFAALVMLTIHLV